MFSFLLLMALCGDVRCRDLEVQYDVQKLQDEIRIVEDKYIPRHFALESWTAIPLRNADGNCTQAGIEINNSIRNQKMLACQDTEFMAELPYIASILDDISSRFDAEVGIVRLSKVASQKEILPHMDGTKFDIEKGSIYRLHIPIVTGENVSFRIEGHAYGLEEGSLYYTNVSKSHSVRNEGEFDRIHLVIDVQANDVLYDHIIRSQEVVAK